jgi:hypothetical protein
MNDNEMEMNQRLSVFLNQLNYLVSNFDRLPLHLQLETLGCLVRLMNVITSLTDEVASLYTNAVIVLGDFEK